MVYRLSHFSALSLLSKNNLAQDLQMNENVYVTLIPLKKNIDLHRSNSSELN